MKRDGDHCRCWGRNSATSYCIRHRPDRNGRDAGLGGGEGGESKTEGGAEGGQTGVAELGGRVHTGNGGEGRADSKAKSVSISAVIFGGPNLKRG